MIKSVLLLGVIVSILIRVFLVSQGKHTADIYLMYNMGASVLAGLNPYTDLDFNSYPPLAIALEVSSMLLSSYLHLSFSTVFKFWPNLADFIVAFLIYKFLIKLKGKKNDAILWAVLFLLNPISIIISSAHGQIDSIVSLFVVISIYLLTFYSSSKHIYLSALCLGIAIAIKPNPLMFLPIFLFYKKTKIFQKLVYVLITMSPLVVTIIPFARENITGVLSRLVTYSGVNDFSYAAILRGIWYQNNAVTNIPLAQEILTASKTIFVSGVICLTLILAGFKNLPKACLTIYLLFFGFYFGIGSQYLTWVLPFAFLLKDKMVFPYIVVALFAQIGFYLFFGPEILFGKVLTMVPYQTKYIYLYFLGNLLFWIFSLTWLFVVIKSDTALFLKFGKLRKSLIYISVIVFILSFIPMIHLIINFYARFNLGE